MKSARRFFPGRYATSSLLLILTAGLCAGIVIITDRQDITSAALLVSALILFLSGILLMTFHRKESLDDQFVSHLQAQGMINLCRVAADLGLQGLSCMVPKDRTGHSCVMHLIPASVYSGELLEGEVFVTGEGEGCAGLLLPPACNTLLQDLKNRYHMIIPDSRDELSVLIHEIIIDVMEIADNIDISWSDDSVRIRIEGFDLINGCRLMSKESPACCTMSPCVTCSLLASCITEGLDIPVRIDRCVPLKHKDTVEAVYTLLS